MLVPTDGFSHALWMGKCLQSVNNKYGVQQLHKMEAYKCN